MAAGSSPIRCSASAPRRSPCRPAALPSGPGRARRAAAARRGPALPRPLRSPLRAHDRGAGPHARPHRHAPRRGRASSRRSASTRRRITEARLARARGDRRRPLHRDALSSTSGRGPTSRNATLWASWVIEAERRKVFFSGDTGLFPGLEDIGKQHGPFDLVMLEVGAYHLRGGPSTSAPRTR